MKYKIGTRGSKLALRQAEYVKETLQKEYPKDEFELTIVTTKGDRVLATFFGGSGGSSGTNAIYFLIKKMLAKNAAIPAQKSVNFLKKLIRFRTPVKNTLARYYYTLFFALFQYPRRYLRKKAKKR